MSIALSCLAALFANGSPAGTSLMTGKWVADLDSQTGLPRDEYLVTGRKYSCVSCKPPRSYPADGKLRPIPSDPNVTSEAVRVLSPRAIETRIITPIMNRTTRMTVAKNGQTATYVSIDHRQPIKGKLRTEYLARRVSAGPAGSHSVSGIWQGVRYVSVPKQLRTTELHEHGNRLTYSVPTGFTYSATYGGSFVLIKGPYHGNILVAVERVSPLKILERRKQGDKIILIRTYTVAPNGRSMEIASTDPTTKITFRVTARK